MKTHVGVKIMLYDVSVGSGPYKTLCGRLLRHDSQYVVSENPTCKKCVTATDRMLRRGRK